MTVDATSAAASAATNSALTTGTKPSTAKQTMDSEMFMALLVAQLTNQDPSSPMDTNEMLAQQTQMAQMEQIVALTSTAQEQFALTMRMAAMDLVGKEVSYYDAEGQVVTGVAGATSFAKSVPSVTVGDVTVPLDEILAVSATGQSPETDNKLFNYHIE